MKPLLVAWMSLLAVPGLAQPSGKEEAASAAARLQAAEKAEGEKEAALDVEKLPFTRETVRLVMDRAREQIQECYEETLAAKSKPPEGKLLTTFTITREGLVKNARVDKKRTTLKEPRLHQCVKTVLTALSFPKPSDGREHPIEYPFNLKAIR